MYYSHILNIHQNHFFKISGRPFIAPISPMAVTTCLFIIPFLLLSLHPTDAQIGVCYGQFGNNLPCAQDVVDLYQSNNIGAMRLYAPDEATLQALQGTNIKLMLGVYNQDIKGIACDQATADDWVQTNVVPYAESIKYIAVGNEIHPTDPQASSMEPAMQNILNALNANGLGNQIKVSTAVNSDLITNSYPPSNAQFINLTYITPIINFLTINDSPLLINLEPYIAYENNKKNISLAYALFNACGTVFTDPNTKKEYNNLFDALYDAMYVAIQKVVTPHPYYTNDFTSNKQQKKGRHPVNSESGWSSHKGFGRNMIGKMRFQHHEKAAKKGACGLPLDGGEAATVQNAKMFYTNMINHVKKGTPLTQGQELEVYLFAMFDENLKPGDASEQHYGLFSPDGQPKYGQLNFCP